MERILETNLQGGPINQLDGSIKVVLEGTKKEILEFVERLKAERPELAENPVMVGPTFVFDLQVPEKMVMTHSLQMNQFSKAIIYLAKMSEKLDKMEKTMVEKFDGLGEKIGGLGEKIGGMSGKIDGLGSKIDGLPERIDAKLGKKIDSLGEKIDSLPIRIAKAFKQIV